MKPLQASPLVLHALGPPRLEGASSMLSSRRKDLALLAYLHLRHGRKVARAELSDLLWGDREEGRGRQSLRQALLELKRILGPALDVDGDDVRLVPGAVALDAEAFEQDLAAGRTESAVGRWKGNFLAGLEDVGGEVFRAWLEAERERLRRLLASAFESLMAAAGSGGRKEELVAWGERWTAALPADERGHLKLIEALEASGRMREADARFLAATAALQKELGEPPSADLTSVGARVKRSLDGAPRHTPGSAALFSPDLVGRAPTLAELTAALTAARSGRPTVVLIEGESGIGKTRLVDEFLRSIPPRDAVVIRPSALDAGSHDDEYLRRIVTSLAAIPGFASTPPDAVARLATILPSLGERYATMGTRGDGAAALGLALSAALGAVAGERPVILVIDDYHAAAAPAHSTIEVAAASVEGPVLLLFLATTDRADLPGRTVVLKGQTGLRTLKLQPLSLDEIGALMSSMLVLPAEERHALASRLLEQTAGNPLYAVELIGALVDEGVLFVGREGAWHVQAEDEWTARLSTGLEAIVARRVARVEGDSRRLAEVLAVLGNDADEALQRAVSDLPPVRFDDALASLITSRLVREQQRIPGAYGFSHVLTRRTLYDGIPRGRRERMHGAAAKALRRRGADDIVRRASLSRHAALSRRAGRPWWRSPSVLAALLVVLAGGSLAAHAVPESRWALVRTLMTRRRPTLSTRRVVVAPLENRTGDSTLTPFGDLAADWMAQGLMRTGEFEVVDPRTAAVAARIVERIPRLLRTGDRAIALAEETGAGSVISGAYYREGDTIRVSVSVTETATGRLLRSLTPVTGTRGALSRLVDSLGQRAVAALVSASDTVSAGLAAGLGEAPSYEAYVETSRAWESFYRDDTADVFRRITRATTSDSTYMPPLLMRAYVLTRYADWPRADSALGRVRARRSMLTPTESAILDIIEADIAGDLPGRLGAARRLTRLAPASTEGFTLAADVALRLDHPREAMDLLAKVDPERGLLLVAGYYWYTATQALHSLGDHEAEIRAAQRAVRQFPADGSLRYRLVAALAASGREIEAMVAARELIPGDRFPAQSAEMMGMVAALELRAHGNGRAALEALDSLAALTPPAAPDSASALFMRRLRGELLYALGRWRESERMLLPLRGALPDELGLTGRLATLDARLGRSADARRVSLELGGRPARYLHGRQTFWQAHIAAALGDHDLAVVLLRQAYAEGYPVSDDLDLQPELDRDFTDWMDYPALRALLEPRG